MKALGIIVVCVILGFFCFRQQARLTHVQAAQTAAENEAAELRAKVQEAEAQPKVEPGELTRLREEHAELIKLRGEVNALRVEAASLRKEKEDLAKKLAAASAKASAREAAPAVGDAANSVQIPATPNVVGNQIAQLRQKVLSGQPLTEAEQALAATIRKNVSEFEKTPETFGSYQSSYISSILGWNNDPRAQQLEKMFTAATRAAQTRGVTFNAPGQTPETWTEAQAQLNNRVANGVQNLLNDSEKAVLNNAVTAIMSADIPTAPRQQ